MFYRCLLHSLSLLILLSGLTCQAKKPDWIASPVIDSDRAPFILAIKKAGYSLQLGSYKLHAQIKPNDELIQELASAKGRGANVTVIVEEHLTPEEQKQLEQPEIKEGDALKIYQDLGITVRPGNPKFTATHEKILFADGAYALVGNTNFDKNFVESDPTDPNIQKVTRDFSLFLWDPETLDELEQVFTADIQGKDISLPEYRISDIEPSSHRLAWGPDQHLPLLLEMITSAKESICIYQQALQDANISKALQDAARRGVDVRLLMSQFPFGEKHGNKSAPEQELLTKARGKVRLTGETNREGIKLHVHAKVMIVDEKLMYLGSANFYTPALTKDRQVGVITRNAEHIQPVLARFLQDWQAEELQ